MSLFGKIAGAVGKAAVGVAADAAVGVAKGAAVGVAKGVGKAALGVAGDVAVGVAKAAVVGAVKYVVCGISCADSGESLLSDSLIYTGVAKEFCGVGFSEWTQALDDNMVVACNEVAEALNREARRVGTLSWDNVLKVFLKCQQITKDDGCSKRIKERKKFEGSAGLLRKRKIITWLKTLMNDRGEQDVFDNSRLFTPEILDRLADNALHRQSSSERLMEIAVIRFPTKFNSKIKVYRLQIGSWFQSKAELEIDYETFVFKPNTRAIDDRFASRARRNLSIHETFKF